MLINNLFEIDINVKQTKKPQKLQIAIYNLKPIRILLNLHRV